jgi:hypothetical protein
LVSAQDVFTSNGSGSDYNTAANWSVARDGDNPGSSNYPGETSGSIDGADQVVVDAGHSIVVDADIPNSLGSVTVNATADLDLVSFDMTNTGVTSVSGTLSMGSGTHTLIGDLQINTSATFNGNTASISMVGNISISGLTTTTTFNEGTATFSFGENLAYTITADGDVAFDRITHSTSSSIGTRTLNFIGSGATRTFTINTSYTRSGRSLGTVLTSALIEYATDATLIYGPDGATMTIDADEWPTTNGPDNIEKLGGSALTINASRSVDSTFQLTEGTVNVSSGTLTINGTFDRRTAGTTGITGTVAYAATGSNLFYNTGSNTTIGAEWPAASSPENVNIQVSGSLTSSGDIDRSIAEDLIISVGTLDLNGGTLTVAGSVTGSDVSGSATIASGTTLQMGNGAGANENQTISGTLTLTLMEINKSAGNGTTVTMTGSSGLTFQGTSILTITAGTFDLNGSGRLAASPGTLTIASGATLRTGGTSLTSITTISASAGTIVFSGSSQETLPTGITIGTVEVDNSAGARTNPTDGTLTVNGLTLTDGIIVTSTTDILQLSGSAASVGGSPSATAMIDGPLRWTIDDNAAHTFPVGDGANYSPAVFTFNGTPNDVIQIQYLNSAPGGNVPAGISAIATHGHYLLTRPSGSSTVDYDLTLRYTGSGFTPESRNNILVQNGGGPDYSVPAGQVVDDVNDDVTATGITAFPTNGNILAFGAGGTTNTWFGGTGNWNLAGNWSGGIPLSTDDVVISAGQATVPSGYTTAVAQTLTVQSSAILILANANGISFGAGWDPDQTTFATGATVQFNNGPVYVDDYINLTINGASGTSGSGTITVAGNMVKNSSTAFSTSVAITVAGTYTNTLGNATYSGGITISGSTITLTAGTIGGTVILDGSAAQTVAGASINFANLTLDNGSGFTFSAAASISGTLTLTDGILDNGANPVTLGSGATISGGSDAAHISGPVRNTGTGSKTYPVGDNGNYRPVVSNLTGTSPVVQFQAFDTAPNNSFDPPLVGISEIRFFQGQLISGSISGGSVTLSYGADDGVDEFNESGDVVVAYSSDNATDAYSSFGGQSSGSAPGGTVTSTTAVTTMGFFTLGTVTGDNPLPVELTNFTAEPSFNKVVFNWVTASETENLGFNIYKKLVNESEWKIVNKSIIAGRGNASEESAYQFVDADIRSGATYNYKLESVSYNGVVVTEKNMEIAVPVPQEFVLFNNYPNPFNPNTTISFQVPEFSNVNLTVYDLQGKTVKEILKNAAYESGQYNVVWDASDNNGNKVSSGMYVYKFSANNFVKLGKMVLMK